VERLRNRGMPVRALVHREDERTAGLRVTGAEVVVADLTVPMDVARAVEGCRRIYFGMSVSPPYLEATVIAAAVARERGDIEAFVNISQMTVSQMSLTKMTDSPQQRQHWLAEQVLNWPGLPRRPCPPDGVPRKSSLHELGRSVDSRERHDPAAVRHGANVPGRG
jgi:NAD(P)H dehydrogenase (quinone)